MGGKKSDDDWLDEQPEPNQEPEEPADPSDPAPKPKDDKEGDG